MCEQLHFWHKYLDSKSGRQYLVNDIKMLLSAYDLSSTLYLYLEETFLYNVKNHHITMTSKWARWHLKSPASWLFIQLFIQTQIKENIKAPRHWPLRGEFTGYRWIPHTKGQ